MHKTITGKDIFHQLKADLIGKDAHRGVTFTYTWLANQFGHFALGFIPALLVYAVLLRHNDPAVSIYWATWGVSGFWLVFELYNFLGPLLLNRVSRAKRVFVPSSKRYVFKPAWGNIAFDTLTDLGFFGFGTFSARLYENPTWANGCTLVGIFLMLLPLSHYWYVTKLYLQSAEYPFQCRISQWAFTIGDADKRLVNEFLQAEKGGNHLLIFGGLGNGKTSLGVGIATEHSIRHETCFYTTGMKLYSLFPERNAKSLMNNKKLWTWRQASLLVIDDVNPGGLIDDLITPDAFLKLLDANPRNRETLANKTVIWVLGNDDSEALPGQTWADMLLTIGVDRENIFSVHLPLKEVPAGYQGKI